MPFPAALIKPPHAIPDRPSHTTFPKPNGPHNSDRMCFSSVFLPFATRHQKLVVSLPSLYSPEQSDGDGWCRGNLQNTHFSGLTRQNPVFERSVLKYVSIKNKILTPSGQKSRVCVNALDRLLPPNNERIFFRAFFESKSAMHTALRAMRFALRRCLGRLPGVRFRLCGLCFLLPFGQCVLPSGGVWDACAACGREGLLGAAPLLDPLCTPPGAPPRKFSIAAGWRGHASCAAGASLTRCARSGDLPPRRVNARVRFRSGQSPLQPTTIMPFIL